MTFLADCQQETAGQDWAVASIFIVLIVACLIGGLVATRRSH